jgi:hypothetical protein
MNTLLTILLFLVAFIVGIDQELRFKQAERISGRAN